MKVGETLCSVASGYGPHQKLHGVVLCFIKSRLEAGFNHLGEPLHRYGFMKFPMTQHKEVPVRDRVVDHDQASGFDGTSRDLSGQYRYAGTCFDCRNNGFVRRKYKANRDVVHRQPLIGKQGRDDVAGAGTDFA